MKDLFPANRPLLALAPMQDVTDWAFWKLIAGYGGPDLYFTEYFRVTSGYRLQRSILRSIIDNPTGKPAIAQIIGNDPGWMVKCARQLEGHPVAAVDLNLGCPAPVVYRKCAGGGLLRDPARVHALLGALRAGIEGRFTVKTRLGFSDPSEFDRLLDVFSSHRLDLLTVHARTVAEKYGPHVHLDRIAQAVAHMPCPVIANGNVGTVAGARRVWEMTGAQGLMIGRAAIRNPWIFQQIRDDFAGNPIVYPTGRDVLAYVEALYESSCSDHFPIETGRIDGQLGEPSLPKIGRVTSPRCPTFYTYPAVRLVSDDVPEISQVQKMKKYMNFLGEALGPDFLHAIRRVTTKADFFHVCRKALDHAEPMALEA